MSRSLRDIATQEATPSQATAVSDEIRVLKPTKQRIRISDLWTTSAVARVVGVRDMKIKYKQSALGPIWLFLQPIGMLLAVIIAFSAVGNVKTEGVSYVPFALVGLCVWLYIQTSVATAALIFPSNFQLVRRSACPRIALITGTVLSNFAPLVVVLTATLVVTVADRPLPTQVLLLPLLIVWVFIFVLAASMLASAVGARFRDVVAIVPLLIQAGLFISPVGYPVKILTGIPEVIVKINPISGLIEAWRWCLLGTEPLMDVVLIAAGWTVLFMVGGWVLFARLEVRFADFV